MPRPMRFRSFRLCAGFREVRLSSSAIVDLHEVPDLSKHACEDRAVVVLGTFADPAEPERAERAAVPLALADLATNLRYSDLRHGSPGRGTSRFPGSPPLVRFADRRLRRLLDCYRMLVGENLADRQASCPRDLVGAAQSLQPVHRRLRHVDRVRRAEALREDVADPGQLEDGANSAAGNDAGSFARGAQEDAGSIGAPEDLVRDRRAVLRHREEILLRVVDRLRDRERHLTCLAVADPDAVDLVTDDDECREGEPPTALDDLRDTVDLDHALLELAGLFALDHGAFDARELWSSAQAVTFRSDRVLWPRKASQARTQGSARSRRLRARLRTRHGAALQRARGREMVGWWPTLEL